MRVCEALSSKCDRITLLLQHVWIRVLCKLAMRDSMPAFLWSTSIQWFKEHCEGVYVQMNESE